MNKLIIIGASGHGKVCADIGQKMKYKDITFLDDDKKITSCSGYDVVGTVAAFRKYLKDSVDFFVAIGNPGIRQKIVEEIENTNGRIVTLIHPDAVICDDVEIGSGSVVMAGVVINAGTIVGKGGIVNTSSSIDHDCKLEDYVHISVGSHIAGTVNIGMHTWIGVGATVSNNVYICGDCLIGAGAVVVADIKQSGIYVGVPARKK